jgi:hypothetical protein
MSDHWYADTAWEDYEGDDGYWHVRAVACIAGPPPFNGLRARDEQHAEEIACELNRVYERTVPVKDDDAESTEPPSEMAAALTDVLRDAGMQVVAHGDTLTITAGPST